MINSPTNSKTANCFCKAMRMIVGQYTTSTELAAVHCVVSSLPEKEENNKFCLPKTPYSYAVSYVFLMWKNNSTWRKCAKCCSIRANLFCNSLCFQRSFLFLTKLHFVTSAFLSVEGADWFWNPTKFSDGLKTICFGGQQDGWARFQSGKASGLAAVQG